MLLLVHVHDVLADGGGYLLQRSLLTFELDSSLGLCPLLYLCLHKAIKVLLARGVREWALALGLLVLNLLLGAG